MWITGICDYYKNKYGLMYNCREAQSGSVYISFYERGIFLFRIRISDHPQKYGHRITTIRFSKKALKDKLYYKIKQYLRIKNMREKSEVRNYKAGRVRVKG